MQNKGFVKVFAVLLTLRVLFIFRSHSLHVIR